MALDTRGNTALHVASMCGDSNLQAVMALIKAGKSFLSVGAGNIRPGFYICSVSVSFWSCAVQHITREYNTHFTHARAEERKLPFAQEVIAC